VTDAAWYTPPAITPPDVASHRLRRKVPSGCAVVLVNQAAKEVDAFDARGNRQRGHGRHRCAHRNVEVDAAVRPGRIVVLEIASEDTLQLPTVPDKCPIQTLGADGPHPPFRICVRLWRTGRNLERVGCKFSVPIVTRHDAGAPR
jgi:hypothetical protein